MHPFETILGDFAWLGDHPDEFDCLAMGIGNAAPRLKVADELEAVRNYLEVEHIRFGDRLRVTFDVEPGVETRLVPPLVLQPLVENAVLHGVAPRTEGGEVRIHVSQSNPGLMLRVEDDGPGPGRSTHRGCGTSLNNLNERLRLTYGERAALETGPGDRGGTVNYCCLDEVAALAWTANLAALEIHAPMARAEDIESPAMVVFDLDPGAPATITECAQVALDIKDLLDHLDLEVFAKTSGSKGMQLYVPLNTPHTHSHASSFALAVAQLLEKQHPKHVLSVMTKALRKDKIFIDWSQNSRHKTTIAAYSLRAKDHPTVSTPITWDEVADGADGQPLSFEAAEVLDRVESLGDLFEPTATLEQELPALAGR